MDVVTFAVATNGSGAYTGAATLSSQAMVLFSVEVAAGTLDAATVLTLSCAGAAGVAKTIFTKSSAGANAVYYPRTPIHDASGVASSVLTTPLIDGDLTLAITGGGDTKTGTVVIRLQEV